MEVGRAEKMLFETKQNEQKYTEIASCLISAAASLKYFGSLRAADVELLLVMHSEPLISSQG